MTLDPPSEPYSMRLEAVRDLIELRDTLSNCRNRLLQFPWNFEGQATVITRLDVETVLTSFLQGKISSKDLEEWADLLELREDVAYEADHREWLNFALFNLSDQHLNGAISATSVSELLSLDEETVLYISPVSGR